MNGARTRLMAILLAAALASFQIAACGGGDSSSSQTESSATTEASQEGGAKAHRDGASGLKQFSVEEVSTPLQVSGGGSEQFLVKGANNSIQEFGEEGDESELQEAAEAVHDFYVARAAGHWSEACSRMASSLREKLEQLAAKSTNVEGCAPFLEAFTTPLPAAAWRETTTVNAGSLRHEDEQGYLIYTGAKKTVYAMPLREEDGVWKVTELSATTLD